MKSLTETLLDTEVYMDIGHEAATKIARLAEFNKLILNHSQSSKDALGQSISQGDYVLYIPGDNIPSHSTFRLGIVQKLTPQFVKLTIEPTKIWSSGKSKNLDSVSVQAGAVIKVDEKIVEKITGIKI